MTYAYYHEVKKGLSPKTAPTYIREGAMPEKNEAKASSYKCTVCGYIYDPAKGDPDGGIKPGTPFEQIPDTWVCPVCGADKSVFEKVNELSQRHGDTEKYIFATKGNEFTEIIF